MLTTRTVEAFKISVATDVATVCTEDGSVQQLPLEVLFRSCLLQQTLSEAPGQDEMQFKLPVGVMNAWLDGLDALRVSLRTLDAQPQSKLPKHNSTPIRLLESLQEAVISPSLQCTELTSNGSNYVHRNSVEVEFSSELKVPGKYWQWFRTQLDYSMQAADFLRDQDAVTHLCSRIAANLFQSDSGAGDDQRELDLIQEICKAPKNLQYAVLSASDLPLFAQLTRLPENLHQVALYAAFPSITATSSLIVDLPYFTSTHADPFWRVLGKERDLKHIDATYWQQHRDTVHHIDALRDCIARLVNLQSLNLSPAISVIRHREAELLNCLTCLRCLTHLDVSQGHGRVGTCPEASLQAVQALGNLTTLCSLLMRGYSLTVPVVTAFGSALVKLSQLRSLNLSACETTAQGSDDLAKYISRCTALLDLRCGGDIGSVELLRSICRCSRLEHLELPQVVRGHCNRLYLRRPESQLISNLKRLRVLSFSCRVLDQRPNPSPSEFLSVAECLSILTGLREIHVCCEVFQEEVAAIYSLLPSLVCLEVLSITDTRCSYRHGFPSETNGTELLGEFGGCFSKAPTLTRLALSSNCMVKQDIETLASCLQSVTGLVDLKLAKCNLQGDGAEALAQSVVHLTSLKHLSLAQTGLDDSALKQLVAPVGQLSALQTLCLDKNWFGAEGWAALSLIFLNLTRLQELSLIDNKLDHQVNVSRLAFLSHLRCLQKLMLDSTRLSEDHASTLVPVLGKLTNLEHLSLSGNGLTCQAIRSLSPQIRKLVVLQHIDLQLNKVRDDGARSLVHFARLLPCLRVLNLRYNLVGDARVEIESSPHVGSIVCGLGKQLTEYGSRHVEIARYCAALHE